MTTKFLVSADHASSKFRANNIECEPRYDAGFDRWYVSISPYGCSKTYPTPEAAIRGMLRDHACTNIRITAVEE